MSHAFACQKHINGEARCERWCGLPDRCLSTRTYREDYMQMAYERGQRDAREATDDAQRYRWLRDRSGADIRTLLDVSDFTSLDAFIDAKLASAERE